LEDATPPADGEGVPNILGLVFLVGVMRLLLGEYYCCCCYGENYCYCCVWVIAFADWICLSPAYCGEVVEESDCFPG